MYRAAWSRFREGPTESAFTLVELAVVMLIVAMLIAIAVPTFLGARRGAQDRAAQSSIRNVLASAKVLYSDAGDYRDADASALGQAEPNIRVVAAPAPSTDANVVSVYARNPNTWYATALSASGACFALRDTTAGNTGTSYRTFDPPEVDDCNAIGVSIGSPNDWKQAWP